MLLQFHGARKDRGFTKEAFFLTKPLLLGIGAPKVLPNLDSSDMQRAASSVSRPPAALILTLVMVIIVSFITTNKL